MKNCKWYIEQTSEDEVVLHSLKEIIYTEKSPYQRIEIIHSGNLGRCLLLDGKMQSSEVDEFIYHEALVHPVMLLSESINKVLIAGGGEGATLREVLKYPVSEVVMVELDETVIKVAKQYLPEWNSGAFDDPRVKIVIDDARSYIEKTKKYFDVIIIDLPEPAEGGPAYLLYTKEFYERVKEALTDKGMMVTQSASASVNNLRVFVSVVSTLKQVFPYVKPYITYVPSFFAPWGFVLVSKKNDPDEYVNKIKDKLYYVGESLKFYDMDAHISMFSLPKHIKKAFEKGGRVIRDDSPLSFY
ncbi:MAG: polyamine aminopropyltransferase [Thermodesulfovibrio sp.]|nr:polyamine aminopropyltransferase [Thermodesulfovibrio sp.]MDW7973089.1 polyamine aminopropyltransferase [Thermodesulfovibrio sp.]